MWNTYMWVSWINLASFLPLTSIVKVHVALFPDSSAAVYVIAWVPWLNLSNGLWFDDMVSRILELSVAAGSVQFTSAENRSRSAYTTNGLDGHVSPNVGGRTSAIWISSSLATTLWAVIVYIINKIILAFWSVLAYDLLEDRHTNDLIIAKFYPLCLRMAESFENLDNVLLGWAEDKVKKKKL